MSRNITAVNEMSRNSPKVRDMPGEWSVVKVRILAPNVLNPVHDTLSFHAVIFLYFTF